MEKLGRGLPKERGRGSIGIAWRVVRLSGQEERRFGFRPGRIHLREMR